MELKNLSKGNHLGAKSVMNLGIIIIIFFDCSFHYRTTPPWVPWAGGGIYDDQRSFTAAFSIPC